MTAPYVIRLVLGLAVACCVGPQSGVQGADAPVWQPYRETLSCAPPEPAALPTRSAAIVAPAAGKDVILLDQLSPLQVGRDDGPTVASYSSAVSSEHFCCLPASQRLTGACPPSYCPVSAGDPPWVEVVEVDPALAPHANAEFWTCELLPSDTIWKSYWAGAKEPRMSATVFRETSDRLTLLDVTLGGRTAIWRYGYQQAGRPLGWELQLEGAALLRLNLDRNWDFDAADFRFGVPLIWAADDVQWKLAYYHLSSHVGDEFLVRNPGFTRINYSRDVLVLGISYFPRPAARWYGEAGWAFYEDEGTQPWEFQFGLDLAQPGPTGTDGTPFLAVNGHLRQEVHFGGNLVFQAGWLWRGGTGRVLRTGFHYFNGKSNQFSFFDNFEQQLGWGLWQEY